MAPEFLAHRQCQPTSAHFPDVASNAGKILTREAGANHSCRLATLAVAVDPLLNMTAHLGRSRRVALDDGNRAVAAFIASGPSTHQTFPEVQEPPDRWSMRSRRRYGRARADDAASARRFKQYFLHRWRALIRDIAALAKCRRGASSRASEIVPRRPESQEAATWYRRLDARVAPVADEFCRASGGCAAPSWLYRRAGSMASPRSSSPAPARILLSR